jgi:hypothetical protein
MSITRKEILIKKYLEFQNLITTQVSSIATIFPKIDEIDLSDIVLLVEVKFNNLTYSTYRDMISELLSQVILTDDEKHKLIPIVEEFINWYFTIFKTI